MTMTATNTDVHADLNAIVGAVVNLRHLLDSACLALGELDYGTGTSRNHELDRANGLVDVSRTMVEMIESDLDRAYPALAKGPTFAPVVSNHKPVPVMDFTGWTVLDFELAMEGWIRMEHALTGILNQPRASAGDNYHAGAGYFRDFQDDWAALQLDRIVKHLREARFPTAEEEQRRLWLLVRFAGEYPDNLSDLLAIVNSQIPVSK